MGECPPGLEIDRIKNELGYQPGNCRWVHRKVQELNKSKILSLTVGDKTLRLKEWAKLTGIDYQVIRYRFKNKWPAEHVISPVYQNYHHGI